MLVTDGNRHRILRRLSAAGVFALATVAAFATQSADPGLDTIRVDALKGHMFFLAAPEMAGRDSLSVEGRSAAKNIAAFFYRMGLKPVGDRGTFFQAFPMTQSYIDRAQTKL